MTIFGKYFGSPASFGAFGGKDEIMSIIEPNPPASEHEALLSSYEYNFINMAASVAILENLWTEKVANKLYKTGQWLQDELQKLVAGTSSQVTGVGSLMAMQFSNKSETPATEESVAELRELFFFDMLRKGFYVERPGMVSLMTVTSKAELKTFVDAVRQFLEEREELIC